jgi:hypothetical protein
MTHKIMLCFVRSDSDILESSWLNRAAASLTSNDDGSAPFIHSELLFCPPGDHTTSDTVSGLACSIVYSGSVHLERKRFARKEWFFRSMECSKGQYDSMLQFCEERKGESFNHLGYFLYWSPLRPSPTSYNWLGLSSRWYCSEIVIAALKEGGILSEEVSYSMHPNDLYKLVQNNSMADCGRNLRQIDLRFV